MQCTWKYSTYTNNNEVDAIIVESLKGTRGEKF